MLANVLGLSMLAAIANAVLTSCDAPSGGYAYALNIPDGLGDTDRPLHLFLHGTTDNGDTFDQQKLGEGLTHLVDLVQMSGDTHKGAVTANEAFILLAPVNDAPQGMPWDVGRIKSTLDFVVAQNNISRSAMSISGHSAGSKATWAMIQHFPTLFTCAVPISDGPTDFSDLANVAHLPIMAFYGVRDRTADCTPVVQANRTLIETYNSTTSSLVYVDGNHKIGDSTYLLSSGALVDWIVSHQTQSGQSEGGLSAGQLGLPTLSPPANCTLD